MRLSPTQAQVIREQALATFGPGARVLLFGSRTDDSARGGDIDLLVEVEHPLTNRAAAAARFAAELQLTLGDQRIDVLLVDPQTQRLPIHDAARKNGVLL
jgi:predicted nucleotidyltransferase